MYPRFPDCLSREERNKVYKRMKEEREAEYAHTNAPAERWIRYNGRSVWHRTSRYGHIYSVPCSCPYYAGTYESNVVAIAIGRPTENLCKRCVAKMEQMAQEAAQGIERIELTQAQRRSLTTSASSI